MWLKQPSFALPGHCLVVLLDCPFDGVHKPRLATYARHVLIRHLVPVTLAALSCLGAPGLVALVGGEHAAGSDAFPRLFALAVLPLVIGLLRASG